MKPKFKNKIIKGLAISMAFSMIFSTNAFATPIDLANSEMDVKTDTLDKSTGTDYFADEENEWLDGTINEEVRVTVDLASQFEITIPKEIVLNGEDGTAQYKVKAVGDIAGDQKLSVVPDANFVLSEAGGKADVTATVTQPDTEYVYTDLQGDGTEYDGSIAATLTAGEWSGKFNFNIKFDGGSTSSVLPEVGQPLESYSWAEIATISEAGEAANYFSVGDEKTVQIGTETYTLQVMGFNHDDLADGSGKAGITLGLKETINCNYFIKTNIGGWKESEMRTYLQDNILPNLSQDLQDVIKTVNKKTSVGNASAEIITSEDKLFLFSEVEIFGTTTYSASGEGEQYTYYTNGGSVLKYSLENPNLADTWFERSPVIKNVEEAELDKYFGFVDFMGNPYWGNISNISFGFCI